MKTKSIVSFSVLLIALFIASQVSAEGTKYYVVQVGYYKNKTILEKDFNFFVRQGLPAYKVAYEGGHRIYVGNYASREEAEKVAQVVNNMGFQTLIRTMEKKPASTAITSAQDKKDSETAAKVTEKTSYETTNTQPEKSGNTAYATTADKADTSNNATDTTNKLPGSTVNPNLDSYTAPNDRTTSSKVQVPQKAENGSLSMPETSGPEKQGMEQPEVLNKSNRNALFSMFYTTFIIIVLIGTSATYRRNR